MAGKTKAEILESTQIHILHAIEKANVLTYATQVKKLTEAYALLEGLQEPESPQVR